MAAPTSRIASQLPTNSLLQTTQKQEKDQRLPPLKLSEQVEISRYEVGPFIGEGSFGRVFGAYDTSIPEGSIARERAVAIKFFQNASNTQSHGHQNALHELKMLEAARGLPNVLQVQGWGIDQEEGSFFIVTELLRPIDVRPFDLVHLRFVGEGILNGVSQLHRRKMTHADLKETHCHSNIQGQVVLADLGLSYFEEETPPKTIQTLPYRDPRVFIGATYDNSVDMWSVGCIFYKLFTGRLPFPGVPEDHLRSFPQEKRSYLRKLGMLHSICTQLGTPPKEFIRSGKSPYQYFHENTLELRSLPLGIKPLPSPFSLSDLMHVCLSASGSIFIAQGFSQLIQQMLTYGKKISADNALASPFFAQTVAFQIDGCLSFRFTQLDIYDETELNQDVARPLYSMPLKLSELPKKILCQRAANDRYVLALSKENLLVNTCSFIAQPKGINQICLEGLNLQQNT
jgi:serine/threonine protein kinase